MMCVCVMMKAPNATLLAVTPAYSAPSHGLCLKYASTAEKMCKKKKKGQIQKCGGEQINETWVHLHTPEAAWVC